MSSMLKLMRASRAAARAAACSAVSTASRRGAGAAAAVPYLLLCRSTPAAASPLFGTRCLSSSSSHTARSNQAPPAPEGPVDFVLDDSDLESDEHVDFAVDDEDLESDDLIRAAAPPEPAEDFTVDDNGHVNFAVDDKDLESDEAMWAHYERWCRAFGAERSPEEMQRRFGKFKDFVRFVNNYNRKAIRDGKSDRLEVNMFADGKLAEQLMGSPFSFS